MMINKLVEKGLMDPAAATQTKRGNSSWAAEDDEELVTLANEYTALPDEGSISIV